jgi:hypothetical protein
MLFSGVGATLPGLEGRGSSALPHPSCSCKTLLLNIILILSTFILHSSKTIEISDCLSYTPQVRAMCLKR